MEATEFDPDTETELLNIINPPLVDTIVVPARGWAVARY